MKTSFANIGNLICYEIIFRGWSESPLTRADLLVTITNDAWFGRTSAPYQHFSMAVFRAVWEQGPCSKSREHRHIRIYRLKREIKRKEWYICWRYAERRSHNRACWKEFLRKVRGPLRLFMHCKFYLMIGNNFFHEKRVHRSSEAIRLSWYNICIAESSFPWNGKSSVFLYILDTRLSGYDK